jgi:predicted transcriptional regulator
LSALQTARELSTDEGLIGLMDFQSLFLLNSRVQHPVARVLTGFINVTTVRNYFLFLFLYY